MSTVSEIKELLGWAKINGDKQAVKMLKKALSKAQSNKSIVVKKNTSAVKESKGEAFNNNNNKWQADTLAKVEQSNAQVNNLMSDFERYANYYSEQATSAQQRADTFNAEQAALQRDWSEAMSASAHQREVADLKAAGLNPVISAYGSGASVGSGAAASSSNALAGAFGSLASQALNAVSSLAATMQTNATSMAKTSTEAVTSWRAQDTSWYIAKLNSETSLSMNQATNAMNEYIAKLNNLTSKEIARIAADANVSAANVHAAASEYSAQIAYSASLETARMNNQTSMAVTKEQTSKTFEGMATTAMKKAGEYLSRYLTGTGEYSNKE